MGLEMRVVGKSRFETKLYQVLLWNSTFSSNIEWANVPEIYITKFNVQLENKLVRTSHHLCAGLGLKRK